MKHLHGYSKLKQKTLSIIENSVCLSWTIFSDFRSSIQAVAQQDLKYPIVKTIQVTLSKLQNQHKIASFCKIPSHVMIMGNEAANEIKKLSGVHTTCVPHWDVNFSIRKCVMKRWQFYYVHIDDNIVNKLGKVKPLDFNPWRKRQI